MINHGIFFMCKNIETTFSQDDLGNYYCTFKNYTLSSVFQPIFDQMENIIGVEGLVRIKNESGVAICPDDFFSDRNPHQKDKLMIDAICRVLHLTNFSSSQYRNKKLFLNFLPNEEQWAGIASIHDDLFTEKLEALDIRSEQIVLELLEVRCNNLEKLKHAVNGLTQKGFNLAIDDFGSEYSTPERVKLVSPSILKIDRYLLDLFMHGEWQPLLDAIHIANNFKAKTVIEGIENQTQLDAMLNLGIDMYQGYYLAMPKPVQPAA